MQKENAFWREVIDYLPSLVFLFRIDEEEKAHLIFCNQKIQDYLGYSAKEYVLAFEEDEAIHDEVQQLVDRIAKRSHDVDSRIQSKPCNLTHKEGGGVNFYFQFQLFKTRSSQTNMLAVELKPEKLIYELIDHSGFDSEKTEESTKTGKEPMNVGGANHFVVESQTMAHVMYQIDHIVENPMSVVLQGEPSVGKRTLADELAFRYSNKLNAKIIYYDKIIGMDILDQEARPEGVNIFRMDHMLKLSEEDQKKLVNWKETHKDKNFIVVTTADKSLEGPDWMTLDSKLYYKIGLLIMGVPPLRHRPEDVKAVARSVLDKAAETLHFTSKPYDESFLERLTEYRWENNFDELYQTLRKRLSKTVDGDIWSVAKEFNDGLQEDGQKDVEDIISFDEMNRRYLSYVLNITEGKIYGQGGAAELLGLRPTTLQSKLKKLGIK